MNSGIFIRGIIDDITNNKVANSENHIENFENKIENKNNNYKYTKYIRNDEYKNYIKKEVKNENELSIAILGEYSGKTVYINKLLNIKEDNPVSTNTCLIYEKKLKIKNSLITFNLLDTTDWERKFLSLNKAILKFHKPHGIMIFFNLAYRQTFLNLINYKKKFENTEINLSDTPIVLIGNHLHGREIEVKSEEAIKFTKENNFIGYFEISLNGNNLDESFEYMANFLFKIYYN